jgi:hypothetical protein
MSRNGKPESVILPFGLLRGSGDGGCPQVTDGTSVAILLAAPTRFSTTMAKSVREPLSNQSSNTVLRHPAAMPMIKRTGRIG